jgi:hypothetical protein
MRSPGTPDHYELLGVPTDVSPQDLRRAYRRLVREHHPDRAARHDQQGAAARTAAIVAAYRTLSDPAARRRYDIEAAIPRRGQGTVRTAPRPWAVDLPPRPTHDPVLREVPDQTARHRRRPPADAGTPLSETVPRLALAAAAGLVGLLAFVAGGAGEVAALQLVGIMLLGSGLLGFVLSELARKDSS